jgi:hypothetical protein
VHLENFEHKARLVAQAFRQEKASWKAENKALKTQLESLGQELQQRTRETRDSRENGTHEQFVPRATYERTVEKLRRARRKLNQLMEHTGSFTLCFFAFSDVQADLRASCDELNQQSND